MPKSNIPVALELQVIWLCLFLPPAFAESIREVEEPTGRAVQAAIESAAAQGGGVVYLPPGRYVSGPLWLKDNVELRLEAGATVVMSHEKTDWPAGVRALLNARGAKNIAVTGRGTFDGDARWEYADARGQDPEIAMEQEIARRAGVEMKRYCRTGDVQKYLFVLQECEEVRIEGVTIRNAPLWNVRLQDCNRIWIRGIFLYSDLERGVNSDGIDIVSSSNVLIADSIITTADDAICLKTVNLGQRGTGTVRPVENVVVNNCILSSSSAAMMIGTETHADIRHVLFSNIVVRDSNKVFGINVQDGATVSDVRFSNVTFETNRRHWNWWGSAELMKFVLKRRTPESRLGQIRDITIDGVQGTARGTSLVAGHADRRLENINIRNLRVTMLAENRPDKRATDALVFQAIDGLTLRNVEVDWDRENPEPKWGSALVLRDIGGLVLEGFRGQAALPQGPHPAVQRGNVADSELPRILFFANPMRSDNDVIRRPQPEVLSVAEGHFAELSRGIFDVTITQDGAQVTRERLTRFHAVVFFTAIDPPGVDKDGLMEWIRTGGAFVGIHSTANTYQHYPAFGEMLGARFDRRPWRTQANPQTTVRIQVEDGTHPATAHFPALFEMADDIYLFKDFDQDGVRLLLRLDASSLELAKAGVNPDDERFPVAWTRTHGQGRVFYTALGDWEETWKSPLFRTHLIQGIRWAIGQADAE